MSTNENPLGGRGRSEEERWARQQQQEAIEKMKKAGGNTPATAPGAAPAATPATTPLGQARLRRLRPRTARSKRCSIAFVKALLALSSM
jgi:hypothetical protein